MKNFIWLFTLLATSLILFVLKKDEKLRLYVDYYALNSITIKNKYLLLLINKLHN